MDKSDRTFIEQLIFVVSAICIVCVVLVFVVCPIQFVGIVCVFVVSTICAVSVFCIFVVCYTGCMHTDDVCAIKICITGLVQVQVYRYSIQVACIQVLCM